MRFFLFFWPNCLDVVAAAVVESSLHIASIGCFLRGVFFWFLFFFHLFLWFYVSFYHRAHTHTQHIRRHFIYSLRCVFDVSRALFWLFFLSVINRICQPKCWCCLYYVPAYNNVPCNFDFFLDFVVLHFEPACIQICSLPFLLPFDLLSNTYGTVCTVLAIFYADFELFSCWFTCFQMISTWEILFDCCAHRPLKTHKYTKQ